MTEPDAPPGLDLVALDAYLRDTKPGLVTGPLRAELIAGGRSNLTYYLTDGTTRWVLRRPPLGHVLATAHDMSREYRVLRALAGTGIPVPGTVALCTDPEVLGAPFYLMERVDGVVLRSFRDTERIGPAACEALGAPARRRAGRPAQRCDPEEVGLGDFGRPDGLSEAAGVAVAQAVGLLAQPRGRRASTNCYERLAGSVPASQRYSLLHGDFRLDNVLVTGRADGQPADHRGARLGDGHPRRPARRPGPVRDLLALAPARTTRSPAVSPARPDSRRSSEQIARYADRTGADVSSLDWYVGLAGFKLAVVAGRHLLPVHAGQDHRRRVRPDRRRSCPASSATASTHSQQEW